MDPNVAQTPPVEDSALEVQAILAMLSRRKWLIASTALAVLTTVAVHTLKQPKVYEAAVSVIIDASAPKFLDNNQVQDVVDMGTGMAWYQKEYYETQYKVITSRAVASRVVDKLGLQSDPSFLHVGAISDPDKRREVMEKIDAPGLLQSKIAVVPIKDSRVALIKIEDDEPNRAALLANEIAEAYIAESLNLKSSVTESASKWLEERLTTLQAESKSSEVALYDFKKQADMLTMSLEDRQNMVSQRLTAVNTALSEVELKIAELKARVDAMNDLRQASTGRSDMVHWAESLPWAGGGLVGQLKVQLANARLECADLRTRYMDGHPKLAACEERVESLRKDMVRELDNQVRAAQVELAEALGKQQNLAKMLAASKAEGFEVNKKQIEFDRLKRESDNNQRLYDLVLKRLKDIELSGLLRTSNVRILDAARPSFVPSRPNVKNSLILGALLGVLAGVGLGFLLEKLDNTIKTQADIEAGLGLAFLGFVPRLPDEVLAREDRDLYLFQEPKTAVAESCRAVRTNLLFMSPDKPIQSMLVTSTAPREGKSTTSINMAIAMAQSGNRVLLLDTDMRRPRLHRAFGVSNEVGISSLVVGAAKLEDAIKTSVVPGLSVIPCGPIPPNPAELLHTQAFREVLKEVTRQFDRVILDSPPVSAVADALVLATQVDGVLMVLNASKTGRGSASQAIRGLLGVKANIVGAILNETERSRGGYDGYAYHYMNYSYDSSEKPERVA
jgi:capsular exopolysaccharide synthesis family protein